MKRGQRKLIPGAGPSQSLHVFGAYDWDSGFVSYTTAPRKNTDSFVAFLEHLLSDYPHQKLILVMDNASYHRSATAQAALSLYADRVLVSGCRPTAPFSIRLNAFGCISPWMICPYLSYRSSKPNRIVGSIPTALFSWRTSDYGLRQGLLPLTAVSPVQDLPVLASDTGAPSWESQLIQ